MDVCGIPPKVGLRRISLQELEPDLDDILIVAIIINKQTPRKFQDKNNTDQYRAVWGFTLRDSQRDYINVTFWGSTGEVLPVSDKYYTGDVVEIRNPRINVRKFNENNEQYCPIVTSPFSLTLNEASQISPHDGNTLNFMKLLSLPTKSLSGYVPLRDILNGGEAIKERTIDILGAIKKVGPIKKIKSKTGQDLQMREIILFDHTSSGLRINLWDIEIITRAIKWKPRITVLFITDAKIVWSGFWNTYTASVTSRSIITENPIGKEADSLLNYAKTAPLESEEILDQFIMDLPDPETIKNVMSVQQIHNKMNNFNQSSMDSQFTALIFAAITQFDLDGPISVVRTKCSFCRNLQKASATVCENVECPVALGTAVGTLEQFFDIRIHLSDHTGTLINCRLSGNAADQMLNCSVQQFLRMNNEQKAHLKWKYLLERCAVRIAVLVSNRFFPKISIITCTKADPQEAVQRIPLC